MLQIYLPYILIKHACENNYLRELSYFVWLKKKYRNSCFYHYSINNVSVKTGISRTAARKYMKFYRNNGWTREHHGNLIFEKTLKVLQLMTKHNGARYVGFTAKNSPKEIYLKLYYEILKNKKRQIEFVIRKSDRYNAGSRKRKPARIGASSFGFQISQCLLSRLFNCKPSKVSKILTDLKDRNLVSVQRQLKYIRKMSGKEYRSVSDLLGYSYFWHAGNVFKQECNLYRLTA